MQREPYIFPNFQIKKSLISKLQTRFADLGMRRGFRCLSASVFFAGTGGRANAVVDRLAQQSVPGFAFACITDDAQVATTHPHILVNEQLFEADHAKEASRMLEDSVRENMFFFFLLPVFFF
jgi:hypothetical protein